jgi:hypothetical protein
MMPPISRLTDQRPTAGPRRSGGRIAVIVASVAGNAIAPPMPASPMHRMTRFGFTVWLASRKKVEVIDRPSTAPTLRPTRSTNAPPGNSSAAITSG